MAPLHRFEATKVARNFRSGNYDLRTLALMVFDAVIERMGLAAGASHEDVRGFISGHVGKKLGLRVQSVKRDGERVYSLPK